LYRRTPFEPGSPFGIKGRASSAGISLATAGLEPWFDSSAAFEDGFVLLPR